MLIILFHRPKKNTMHYEAKLCRDRRTILCLYDPGFQRQIFKHLQKSIPFTKVSWIPRTNSSNVTFVGTIVLLRIPQQANIASSSGFRNCKWIL